MKKKIIVVIGTRPEAIKLVPVIHSLQQDDAEVFVCTTGQHSDMVKRVLDFFGVHVSIDFNLLTTTNGLNELASQILSKFDNYLNEVQPDLVVVQGDTTTAFIAGLAAFYNKVPVAHVEAGLRTYNKNSPWPEEGNRTMLAAIADIHFAPTEKGRENLLQEGVKNEDVYVTGNTVIDSLFMATERLAGSRPSVLEGNPHEKMILITSHRRENWGKGLKNIVAAIRELSVLYKDILFVFPVHPNPIVRKTVKEGLATGCENVVLIEPCDYPEFVNLMKHAHLIITDSGGVQEEAPSLGKPVLVTRDTTERPEGVAAGTVKLVGTDKTTIISETKKLLEDTAAYQAMSKSINPYGDGTASRKMADVIYSRI